MTSKVGSLLILLLLLAIPAQAAELQRRITLLNGDVHTGTILERGDGYIVLQGDDGKAVELSLDSIDEIEVLATEGWTPPAQERRYEPAEESWDVEPDDPPRFETDWAEEVDEDSAREWKKRYEGALGGHVLSVAPSIPLMSIGLVELASAPAIIGTLNGPVRAAVGAIGTGMLLGSVALAAGGAHEARKSYGLFRDPTRLRLGIAFGLIGTAAYASMWAVSHGMMFGEISNTNGSATPAMAAMIGMSVGSVIVGNILLMTEAKGARDAAYDEYKSLSKRRRAAALPWLSPNESGLTAGIAAIW